MNDRRAELRRAYEVGRLRSALPWVLWVVPLAFVSVTLCGAVSTAFVGIVLALSTLVVWARWRGRIDGRAVGPGLVAGVTAFALAGVGCFACGSVGCAADASALAVACGIAGLAAGGVVGWRSASLGSGHVRFIAVAATIAGLVGCLGCVYVGATAMLGMVGGVTLATAPLLVRRSYST